jgi:hypothetical protein
MKCKRIYIGQEITPEDWNYGIGSVYLAGPRNPKCKSWRVRFIQKIEQLGSPICLFIPESKNQLSGGSCKIHENNIFHWQHLAMSVASAILFWYPAGITNPQSYVEFGAWHKAERIFLGREDPESTKYLDWLLHKEQRLYPAENADQLVEMVGHWLRE